MIVAEAPPHPCRPPSYPCLGVGLKLGKDPRRHITGRLPWCWRVLIVVGCFSRRCNPSSATSILMIWIQCSDG